MQDRAADHGDGPPEGRDAGGRARHAQMNQQTVGDPKPYQEFFAALEKAMFLKAHEVD